MSSRAALVLVALLGARPACGQAIRRPRILLLGDSIQLGAQLARASELAAYRLERDANVIVQNLSAPGARMTDGATPGFESLAPAVNIVNNTASTLTWPIHVAGLLVALGVNDWATGVPLEAFRTAYGGFLAAIATIPVVCVTPLWRSGDGSANGNGDTLDDFRAAIAAVCTAAGGTVLDGKAILPPEASYYFDGLHPSARGHRVMARAFVAAVRARGWTN